MSRPLPDLIRAMIDRINQLQTTAVNGAVPQALLDEAESTLAGGSAPPSPAPSPTPTPVPTPVTPTTPQGVGPLSSPGAPPATWQPPPQAQAPVLAGPPLQP